MPLKLAVFDFDQTLSTVHLYNALAGDESAWRLPPPHAITEAGQLVRLAELEASPEFRHSGGFVLAAFGGSERVLQLHGLLRQLVEAGVECIICSKGLVGPVRKCLDQLSLLPFFTKVYANVGSSYGTTHFDRHLPPGALGADSRYMGSPELADWHNQKQVLVARALRERSLHWSEAVFVDDHPSEIECMRTVCQTVQVKAQRGIGPREIELLRSLIGGGSPSAGGGGSHSEMPGAALADRGAPAAQSSTQESVSRGAEAMVGSPGGQGSSHRLQAGRAGMVLPSSSSGAPPQSGLAPQHSGAAGPPVGGHPALTQQMQQLSPLAHQRQTQAPQQGATACPAGGGSPEHRGGHNAAVPARSQQYISAKSFVRPMGAEDYGGCRPNDRRGGPRHPTLEEHHSSFTDSEGGCPPGPRSKRRESPWCCSQ